MYGIRLGKAISKAYMGVVFTKGTGKTDSAYLAGRFKAKGFAVEELAEAPAEEPVGPPAEEPVTPPAEEPVKRPVGGPEFKVAPSAKAKKS